MQLSRRLRGCALAGQTAEKKAEAEREGRKRERLEKEVRELKASLEARATEARSKQGEIQAAEEQVRVRVGGWGRAAVGRRGGAQQARSSEQRGGCSAPCGRRRRLSPARPRTGPPPPPPPGRAPGGQHQGGTRRE
jgi:Tfp pilus assembly protein FimV